MGSPPAAYQDSGDGALSVDRDFYARLADSGVAHEGWSEPQPIPYRGNHGMRLPVWPVS
jgi:hypothetical protein